MQHSLQGAGWKHSKKRAELIVDDKVLIEMEFTHKTAFVKIGKRKLKITSEGFWCPRIIITENHTMIAQQQQIGLWGTKSEFVIDSATYTATTKQGILFNISYAGPEQVIVGYKLNTFKNIPKVSFEIKSFEVPENHLLILLALGFYTIKNVALESMTDDFLITSVA